MMDCWWWEKDEYISLVRKAYRTEWSLNIWSCCRRICLDGRRKPRRISITTAGTHSPDLPSSTVKNLPNVCMSLCDVTARLPRKQTGAVIGWKTQYWKRSRTTGLFVKKETADNWCSSRKAQIQAVVMLEQRNATFRSLNLCRSAKVSRHGRIPDLRVFKSWPH